jgi:UDP-N-acetylglucosamine--N-acetylmuramyl-(pentapeptide) pyrophosphoryl-undecaprenol N-acetylglucosamine transferase
LSGGGRPVFVLAAGGTGGHLFPAEAVAAQLAARGAVVHLASDRRGDAFAAAVPAMATWQVAAGRIGGNPIRSVSGIAATALGFVQARRLLRRLAPDAVIGFGGYAAVPTMLAALQLGLPTALHEQNAVLGRANRLLAGRVLRLAAGFAQTAGVPRAAQRRVVHTGNPVRPAIRAAAGAPYQAPQPDSPIELLILGGSQGARIFAEVVPPALAALPAGLRGALRLSQQARPEDCERVTAQLAAAGIAARVAPFFPDVADRLAQAQFVICRAGASTIAELAAVGRPALLVPYPHAMDDHQAANARQFAAAGAGWVAPQAELTPAWLTGWLSRRLADGPGLVHAAAQARRFAPDDAAERLAAFVLALGPAAVGNPHLTPGERAA